MSEPIRSPGSCAASDVAVTPIRPFRGVRYVVDAAEVAAVLGPPDDVTTTAQALELAAQHPANCLRLEIPDPDGVSFRGAAAVFREWLARGILAMDPQPAIYLYAHRFACLDEACERFGAYLLAGLRGPYQAALLAHEATNEDLVLRRERQLAAVQAHAGAVHVIWPGSGELRMCLETLAGAQEPLWDIEIRGERHRLWIVTGATAYELACLVGEQPLVVADGHHRLAAARRLAQRTRHHDPARDPFAWVPVHVVDARDPGLRLRAIHRAFRRLPGDWPSLRAHLARHALVECLGRALPEPEELVRLVEELSLAPQRVVLLVRPDEVLRVVLPEPVEDEPDAAVVDRLLVRHVFAFDGTSHERLVEYSPDPLVVAQALASGSVQLAAFLRPTSLETVLHWARAGRLLPPKTTYFYPKLPQGIVFYDLADPRSLEG